MQLDDSTTQSLHLVLRPLTGAIASSMTQTRSEPGLSGQAPEQRPASVPPTAPPRPPGLPVAAHMPQAPFQAHHNLPQLLQPVIPPHIRTHLQHHLAAMNQHPAQHAPQPTFAPYPAPNTGGYMHGVPPPGQSGPGGRTTPPQMRMFQHYVGQNQRARAAAGMHGIHGNNNINGPTHARSEASDGQPSEFRTFQDRHGQLHPESLHTQPSVPRVAQEPGTGSPFPGFSSSFTRQGQGPNGQRWQVTVNESTMSIPLMPNNTERSASPGPTTSIFGGLDNAGPGLIPGNLFGNLESPTPGTLFNHPEPPIPRSDPSSHPTALNGLEALFAAQHEQLSNQSSSLQSRLAHMEADVRNGQSLSLNSITEARSELSAIIAAQAILRHELDVLVPSRLQGPIGSLPRNVGHDDRLGSNYRNPTVRPARSLDHLRRSPSPAPSSLPSAPRVYLLSSPAGPYALVSSPVAPHGLVYSPSGVYTTWPPDHMSSLATHNAANNPHYRSLVGLGNHQFGHGPHLPFPHLRQGMNPFVGGQAAFPPLSSQQPLSQHSGQESRQQSQQLQMQAQPQQQVQPQAQAQAQQPQHQAAQQLQQPQMEQNQAGNLLRVILPLGGHLWFLIRLLGIVFFFTDGSGWRRTIIVFLSILTVFIAQTGFFAGLQEAIWGPVRRHLEGLLPLAEARGRDVPRAQVAEAMRERQNASEARQPDPTDTAARLLREREERQRGWLNEQIRRVERAIVIFIASFVPGLGERHIAARQAAAAAAALAPPAAPQAEEQEQGSQDVTGQPQTENGEQATPASDTQAGGPVSTPQENPDTSSETDNAPAQEEAAQPLIEI